MRKWLVTYANQYNPYICDRCGKEIKSNERHSVEISIGGKNYYDLCEDCYSKIIDFMANEDCYAR